MAPHAQTGSLLSKIANYIEILTRDPRSTVFVPLAEAYRQMGMLEDALEVVSNGLDALPEYGPGYVALGRIQAQRELWPEAEQAFARALEFDAECLPALKGLARVCGRRGDQKRARQALETALRLQPEDPMVAKMLAALGPASTEESSADVASSSQGPPEPVAVGEEVASEKETSAADEGEAEPIATATIAEIYVQQGLLNKAFKVYRDLLQRNPDNAQLQERCRQLEQSLQAQNAPEAASVDEVSSVPAEPEGGVGGESADGGAVLGTLNRWLDAIRERREHVH